MLRHRKQCRERVKTMKNKVKERMIRITAATMISIGLLAGCGQENSSDSGNIPADRNTSSGTAAAQRGDEENQAAQAGANVTELEVHFGDDGDGFLMSLEDNDTARAIAGYVGTSEWRLPIYERDDDADYSVLQYYDIPSRYEIPSQPQTVTEAKAGEVYYSEPNRIVLYYQDAENSEEYTKIGTFVATEEFVTAVAENPELEGWGNKIILISQL